MSYHDYSVKVFVGSVDFEVDEEELKKEFAQFGDITDAILIRDRETQRSKGYGFITFTDKASVEAAIKGMNNKPIRGRPIVVNYAERKSAAQKQQSNSYSSGGSAQSHGYGYGQQAQGYYPGYGGWSQQQAYAGGWNPQGQDYWSQQYGSWNNQQQQSDWMQQSGQQSNNGYQQSQQYNTDNYGSGSY